MSNINYYNKNKDQLYILHFPGTGIKGNENIIQENIERTIKISNDLSIISIMNQSCYDNSFIVKQCKKNNIKIHNSALFERKWNNTLKIKHILKCLEAIKTNYVLILDGRDTLIINDLDNGFINKYEAFNKPIVFNGTPLAYPQKIIEPLQEVIKIKGKQRFLNAGVCIGKKKELQIFYERALQINQKYPFNNSEQYIIRIARKENPNLACHDENNKLFRICHQYDTIIKNIDGKNIII